MMMISRFSGTDSGGGSWTVRGGRGFGSTPFLVAGIVNLTPDSFSDGGSYLQAEAALVQAEQLARDGARMLDFGAESTRPGADFISPEEELDRLAPVLRGVMALRESWASPDPFVAGEKEVPLVSIDTWRASSAAFALEQGAEIINDISGAGFDPAMPEVLGHYRPGYVLMHCPAAPKIMQQAPRYDNVVEDVLAYFEERMALVVKAGLPEERIILDPGIGFGKNFEHNLELMRAPARLASLGRPLYYGISRKGFFGKLLGIPLASRDGPTHLASALLAREGVYAHRVHDVAGAVAALTLGLALTPSRSGLSGCRQAPPC